MGAIIDVSYWQGKIDWPKTAQAVDMAILRASVGTAKDQLYEQNAQGCRKNGIPFGVYHFIMATDVERAKEEADRFYNAAKKYDPLFWVADVEHPPLVWTDGKALPMNPNLIHVVRAFVARLRQHVGDNSRVIYYGGESVYSKPYGNLARVAWDGLWIAAYGQNDPSKPTSTPKMDCDLHQYSSRGSIAGIHTVVDLNRLMGDKPLAWWTNELVSEQEAAPMPPDDPEATQEQEEADEESKAQAQVDTNGDGKIIRVTEPYAWHIRAGDSTEYESLGTAYQGYEFEYVATSTNGWHAIRYEGKIGWISSKAAKVVSLTK